MSSTDDPQFPSINEHIIDQIRTLKFEHWTIHHGFICVARTLEDINLCVRRSKRERCQTMISQWEALHKNYIELLWKSKDIAGFARSTAIDFVNIMIPQVLKNPSLNIEQKRNTLRDYMNHLEEVGGGSKSLTDGFAELQIGVDLFCEQWRRLVKKPHFVRCITQTQEYGQRLAELDAQLKPLQFKIAALKITLCIVTATRTLISLMDNSSLCRDSVCDASQSSLKKALSRAEDEMEELRRQADVQSTEDVIRDIAAKLGVIVSVWTAIVADLTLVCGLLDLTVRSPESSALQCLFDARLQELHNHYARLAEVFYEFQLTVNDGSLPPRH